MAYPVFGQSVKPTMVSFGDTAPGALPPGFVPALTGGGGPVAWQIVRDESAPSGRVLAQTSTDRTDSRFPICIYERASAVDVDVSVRFKPVAGRVDQAGGIIVRVADKDNYYVVRANALEDNVRLYHVIRGRRTQFAGANTKVRSGVWQALRLRIEGSKFQVHFEGKPLFEASDSRLSAPGRIGLWTKADSVTHFDQLGYSVLRG
jgi:hypothetical protein